MIESAVSFLLRAFVDFFTALFFLRFLMQLRRVSFAGRLGAFVMTLTDCVVKPLRRVLPGFFGLDFSSIAAAILLQLFLAAVLLTLYGYLRLNSIETLAVVILRESFKGCLRAALLMMISLLLIQALLSWTNPYSTTGETLARLTLPILKPIRRFVPLIANVDLSPLIAIVLMQCALNLL
ncbi:MAG: YggT family protein [Candidatus Accumulibacter sp.]|jgi:YggT family protein|nr:YggT family protein [Accumulibacter sp.]